MERPINPKHCNKSFKFVSQLTLLKIYAIVLSHFDYCSLIWDNCSDYQLDKLQKPQNRAARVIWYIEHTKSAPKMF